MNDDEIWDLARKPVTDFVQSIKEMDLNVDKLIQFYRKHSVKEAQKGGIVGAKVIAHESSSDSPLDEQILSPLSRAKLELAIVFAINACYWMYLVAHGEDPKHYEISRDIERVGLFMKRAKEIEDAAFGSSHKRPKIDKEASKRLCMNNMSLKSNWN